MQAAGSCRPQCDNISWTPNESKSNILSLTWGTPQKTYLPGTSSCLNLTENLWEFILIWHSCWTVHMKICSHLKLLGSAKLFDFLRHNLLLPAEAHVLVVGQGTSILAFKATVAGAKVVTLIESSRMLFRMTRQFLLANKTEEWCSAVHLCCLGLHQCRIEGIHLLLMWFEIPWT